jgi:hypothetical protein
VYFLVAKMWKTDEESLEKVRTVLNLHVKNILFIRQTCNFTLPFRHRNIRVSGFLRRRVQKNNISFFVELNYLKLLLHQPGLKNIFILNGKDIR